jgi:hypothetical protein
VKKQQIKWLDEPEPHDYPAALSYLCLTLKPQAAKAVVRKLEEAKVTRFAAKDIFRASGLSLLGVSNGHVEKDMSRILKKQGLSPLLLYRDRRNGKLVIADGYHRLCAVYKFDEDAIIPCKIT